MILVFELNNNIVEGYAKFDFGNGYGYASTKYLKKTD